MSATLILVLIGVGVIAGLILWLSLRSKRVNKKIETAKDVVAVSKSKDEIRKEAIKTLEDHILELEVFVETNNEVIVALRATNRKEKDANEKAKRKATISSLLSAKNKSNAEAKREKVKLEKLKAEDEKITTDD